MAHAAIPLKVILGIFSLALVTSAQTKSAAVVRIHTLGPLNGQYALGYSVPVLTSDALLAGGRYTDWRTGYVSNLLRPTTVAYSTNLGVFGGYQKSLFASAWRVSTLVETGYHVSKINGATNSDSSRVEGVYVHPQLHLERAFSLGKRFALLPSVGVVWKYTSAPFAHLAETEAVANHDVGFGMSKVDINKRQNGLGVQMRLDLGYALD